MKIGYIGLGKMGFNMVERLLEKGHSVVVFDKNATAVKSLSKQGAQPSDSIKSMIGALTPPRVIWLMIPYQAVESVLHELIPLLRSGDTVMDGGNSPYKESMRRAEELKEKGIDFLDVGVSGGPEGARNGACLMIGGKRNLFEKFEDIFRDLAAEQGYGYIGEAGSGHFVKMVHNGIEYGMMQAIAEGFSVIKASHFDLELRSIAELYNHRRL
jgi:6-phosphogluconate dehydrogenase